MSEAVYWEFMIRCEEYKEWYHGRFVTVTPEEAEAMEDFVCSGCQRHPREEVSCRRAVLRGNGKVT